jgi:hypothetical protein
MTNTFHLLVFWQLDLQVAVGRPRGSGETVQPSRSLAERRLTMSWELVLLSGRALSTCLGALRARLRSCRMARRLPCF